MHEYILVIEITSDSTENETVKSWLDRSGLSSISKAPETKVELSQAIDVLQFSAIDLDRDK